MEDDRKVASFIQRGLSEEGNAVDVLADGTEAGSYTLPAGTTTIGRDTGAIFAGFAMVVLVLVPVRKYMGVAHLITLNHLELMNKIMLVTGTLVGYAYAMEFFIAWYSGNPYERYVFINRAFGPYWWAYWTMITCNVISPQFFWFKKMRRSLPVMFVLSIVINIGMWFERFVIVVVGLYRAGRDHLLTLEIVRSKSR